MIKKQHKRSMDVFLQHVDHEELQKTKTTEDIYNMDLKEEISKLVLY